MNEKEIDQRMALDVHKLCQDNKVFSDDILAKGPDFCAKKILDIWTNKEKNDEKSEIKSYLGVENTGALNGLVRKMTKDLPKHQAGLGFSVPPSSQANISPFQAPKQNEAPQKAEIKGSLKDDAAAFSAQFSKKPNYSPIQSRKSQNSAEKEHARKTEEAPSFEPEARKGLFDNEAEDRVTEKTQEKLDSVEGKKSKYSNLDKGEKEKRTGYSSGKIEFTGIKKVKEKIKSVSDNMKDFIKKTTNKVMGEIAGSDARSSVAVFKVYGENVKVCVSTLARIKNDNARRNSRSANMQRSTERSQQTQRVQGGNAI